MAPLLAGEKRNTTEVARLKNVHARPNWSLVYAHVKHVHAARYELQSPAAADPIRGPDGCVSLRRGNSSDKFICCRLRIDCFRNEYTASRAEDGQERDIRGVCIRVAGLRRCEPGRPNATQMPCTTADVDLAGSSWRLFSDARSPETC